MNLKILIIAILFIFGQLVVINELAISFQYGHQYVITSEQDIFLEELVPYIMNYRGEDGVFSAVSDCIHGSSLYLLLTNQSCDYFRASWWNLRLQEHLVRIDFDSDFTEITGVSVQDFPENNNTLWGAGLATNGTHFWTASFHANEEHRSEILCFTENLTCFENFTLQLPDLDEEKYGKNAYYCFADLFVRGNELWTVENYASYSVAGYSHTNLTRYDLTSRERILSFQLPVIRHTNSPPPAGILGEFSDMHIDSQGNIWLIMLPAQRFTTGSRERTMYRYAVDEKRLTARINGYEIDYGYQNEQGYVNGRFSKGWGSLITDGRIIDPLWFFETYGCGVGGVRITTLATKDTIPQAVFWLVTTGISITLVVVYREELFQKIRQN